MSGTLYKTRQRARVTYMEQDWPAEMRMSPEAFEKYANELEKDDFEDDILNLSSSLQQLVQARKDTIEKLRQSAEYLDSIWFRCKLSRSVGTSASVVGGSLTIAGGILTLTTAGAAAPFLIAGIATSSVGAATNIGTSVIEKVINSKEVRDMGQALTRDKELTLKVEDMIEQLRRYKDSVHLGALLTGVELILGPNHLIIALLRSLFMYDTSGLLGISSNFFSDSVHAALVGMNEAKEVINITTAKSTAAVAAGATAASVTSDACKTTASSSSKVVAKDALKYNPLGPDIFFETGKVVGQNSTRLAGKVIVGVSAAFLVWDAIDLGFTVSDLIRKKGSQAGKVLRDKADELEIALYDTEEKYVLDMMNN